MHTLLGPLFPLLCTSPLCKPSGSTVLHPFPFIPALCELSHSSRRSTGLPWTGLCCSSSTFCSFLPQKGSRACETILVVKSGLWACSWTMVGFPWCVFSAGSLHIELFCSIYKNMSSCIFPSASTLSEQGKIDLNAIIVNYTSCSSLCVHWMVSLILIFLTLLKFFWENKTSNLRVLAKGKLFRSFLGLLSMMLSL